MGQLVSQTHHEKQQNQARCRAPFLPFAMGEEKPDPNWRAPSVPFRVLAVTSNGALLWASGTDEAIAVSPDAGAHWQLKHQTQDGNLLLKIQFANDRFGYAAGTGGLILTTENGGESWIPHSAEHHRLNYWEKLREIASSDSNLRKTMPGLLVAPDKMAVYLGETHLAIEYFGPANVPT
jgi:hypothetical protein